MAFSIAASPQDTFRSRLHDTAGVTFGFARGTAALTAAFRLVHDQYVARGYMTPNATGLRVGLHHAVPSTKVFIATGTHGVVGTVSLIADSPLGLPMDDLYRDELAELRAQGRRLTEVSALAIDDAYRTSGVTVLTRLVRLLVLYAAEVARYDDISIVVNPRHVGFYRRLFPDSYQMGDVKSYESVNGAPAVPLRLDLRVLRSVMASRREAGESGGAYEFLFVRNKFSSVLSKLRWEARRSRPTAEQFMEFFASHPALARTTQEQRAFIQSLYPDVDVDSLVAPRRWPAVGHPPMLASTFAPA